MVSTLVHPKSPRSLYINQPRSDATSSALYLRTLLRALDWAASNAYDVRALLKTMLKAGTVGQLYNVFFDRRAKWKHGFAGDKV